MFIFDCSLYDNLNRWFSLSNCVEIIICFFFLLAMKRIVNVIKRCSSLAKFTISGCFNPHTTFNKNPKKKKSGEKKSSKK